MLEQERQRIEQLTAGWDDPTQVDWGAIESGEQMDGLGSGNDAPTGPVLKCTALYSYTVSVKSTTFVLRFWMNGKLDDSDFIFILNQVV